VDRYNDSQQILNYDSRPFNSTTAVLNSWNGRVLQTLDQDLLSNNVVVEMYQACFVEDPI
jgi:hypothetical protein